MKRKTIGSSLFLVLGLLFSGCTSIPQQAYQQPADNALITDAFILKMDSGATTRQQEQAFIKAQRKAWHAQNFALNDVPLPKDLDPQTAEGVNLLELLKSDLKVKAAATELEEALPTPTTEGE